MDRASHSTGPDPFKIDAPQTLTGLFPSSSSSDDGDENDEQRDKPTHSTLPHLTYEIQRNVNVAGRLLHVKQYDFHAHNANRVWPGALRLAEYLLLLSNHSNANASTSLAVKAGGSVSSPWWGNVLELGSGCGLLAMRLVLASTYHSMHQQQDSHSNSTDQNAINYTDYCCHQIVTSDVEEDEESDETGAAEGEEEYSHVEDGRGFRFEGGLIARNLCDNYELNGISPPHFRRPIHIPHTWGTGWAASRDAAAYSTASTRYAEEEIPDCFDTVIASDILLYVNAYPALVQTLCEIIPGHNKHQSKRGKGKGTVLILSWNRRMKESQEFFDRMHNAGFDCTHEGQCIYTFVRRE